MTEKPGDDAVGAADAGDDASEGQQEPRSGDAAVSAGSPQPTPEVPGVDPADDLDHDPDADLPLNVVAIRGTAGRDRYGPLGLVVAIAVLGILLMLVDFRLGTTVLAGSAVTAVVLRAILPTRRAGLLVVRTRTIDLIVTSILAGALLILAIITPSV